jgi:hypothetical protein
MPRAIYANKTKRTIVRVSLAIVFLFAFVFTLSAQDGIATYPVQFDLCSTSMPLVNPASVLPNNRVAINFGRQGHGQGC